MFPVLDTPDKQRDRSGPLTLEAGVKFRTGDAFDELAWKRTRYWSYYPQGHLSAIEGRVPLFSESKPEYRKHLDQPWELDVHDWLYQGVDVPEPGPETMCVSWVNPLQREAVELDVAAGCVQYTEMKLDGSW